MIGSTEKLSFKNFLPNYDRFAIMHSMQPMLHGKINNNNSPINLFVKKYGSTEQKQSKNANTLILVIIGFHWFSLN